MGELHWTTRVTARGEFYYYDGHRMIERHDSVDESGVGRVWLRYINPSFVSGATVQSRALMSGGGSVFDASMVTADEVMQYIGKPGGRVVAIPESALLAEGVKIDRNPAGTANLPRRMRSAHAEMTNMNRTRSVNILKRIGCR